MGGYNLGLKGGSRRWLRSSDGHRSGWKTDVKIPLVLSELCDGMEDLQ